MYAPEKQQLLIASLVLSTMHVHDVSFLHLALKRLIKAGSTTFKMGIV